MPVNIGQIGLGAWGRNLLRTFYNLPGAKLKMGCDLSPESLSKMSASFPGVGWTKNFSELISNDGIDAIVIATPPADHFDLAAKALESGKDVFVEKPLVLNPWNCDALQEQM